MKYMQLIPPASEKELYDLRESFKTHIPEQDFVKDPEWFNVWGYYLIGLRRGYQNRFISEACDEHSSST